MMSEEMRSQQIEQKQIEEMAKVIENAITETSSEKAPANVCEARCEAEALYSAGYRKQSDVIDEFVERVKERLEEFTKQDYEDGVPYYHADCEQIDNVIDDVADEMRQEVEK